MNRNTDDNPENLMWLEVGRNYRCAKTLGPPYGKDDSSAALEAGHQYRYESFSGDPLGDTRQYLFRELQTQKLHGVEIVGLQATPIWKNFLRQLNEV